MKYVKINDSYMFMHMYIYIAFHVWNTEVSNKLADEGHLYKWLIEG